MTRTRANGPEQILDGFAACAFALCVAWSLALWGVAMAGVTGGALFAAAVALAGLRRIGGTQHGAPFAPAGIEFDEPVDDTLLLEDRLEEPAVDSQVVRLFAVGGARAAHVPGELAARIDSFLDGGRMPLRAVPDPPDAAQELYEALADIRRTLR